MKPQELFGAKYLTLLLRTPTSSFTMGGPDCDKLSPKLESIGLRPNDVEPKSPEEQQLCEMEKHVKLTAGKEERKIS